MCEMVDTTIVQCQSERDIMYNMGGIWCPVAYTIAGQCLERMSRCFGGDMSKTCKISVDLKILEHQMP